MSYWSDKRVTVTGFEAETSLQEGLEKTVAVLNCPVVDGDRP